jgi:blue copper oxidase
MKKIKSIFMSLALLTGTISYGQYNLMRVPDTLSGTTFNLAIRDTFKQMIPGNQTITASLNGDWWGPTLIFRKGEVVHPSVYNDMADTTTIHWHGMHLPAIMDGGPHQPIAPYTTWAPYWKVDNQAGTYWYHPHLHMEAQKQLNQGIGGFIIVRDSFESTLPLPRTYGIDDIPLALTDRKFDATNQIVEAPYGDSMIVNGTLRAKYNLPAQLVRLRILDAATERSYNLGFSDNRNFYVIATDEGLLDTPVLLNRLPIHTGERYEILVNCTGQAGTTVDLMAYNTAFSNQIPGGESFAGGPFANYLGHKDFMVIHFEIGAATSGALTTVPRTLTTNSFWPSSSAVLTRNLTFIDSTVAGIPGPLFVMNHRIFAMNYIDYAIPLDNTEIWDISSTSNFGHPFHIHDVAFSILSINGAAPSAYEKGWKDVVFVPANGNVKFIAKFTDYADSAHPYMFHCHIAGHEDAGLMGQFVVGSMPSGVMNLAQNKKMKIYPNPVTGIVRFEMEEGIEIVHAAILNTLGATVKQFSVGSNDDRLDVAEQPYGVYFLKLTDKAGATYIKAYLKE